MANSGNGLSSKRCGGTQASDGEASGVQNETAEGSCTTEKDPVSVRYLQGDTGCLPSIPDRTDEEHTDFVKPDITDDNGSSDKDTAGDSEGAGENEQGLMGQGDCPEEVARLSDGQDWEQRTSHDLPRKLHVRSPRQDTGFESLYFPVTERIAEHCDSQQFCVQERPAITNVLSPLASSPHDVRSKSLDPNACEFTPVPPLSSPLFILNPFCVEHYSHYQMNNFKYPAVLNAATPVVPSHAENESIFAPSHSFLNSWGMHHVSGGFPAREISPNVSPVVCQSPPLQAGMQPRPLISPQQQPLYPLSGTNSHVTHSSQVVTGPYAYNSARRTLNSRDHLSRTLLLIGVSADHGEVQLRSDLEQWGPVRALELERQSEGIVIVHFYDLRHARDALNDLQRQHVMQQKEMRQHFQSFNRHYTSCQTLSETGKSDPGQADNNVVECPLESSTIKRLSGGKAVWARYVMPTTIPVSDANNQGTVVVFNLDEGVSLEVLRSVFQKHGDVKDVREAFKRQYKFVEFYDVRDAANALLNLDGQELCGRCVKIEFSRPSRRFPCQHVNTNTAPRFHKQLLFVGWNGDQSVNPVDHLSGLSSGIPFPYNISKNALGSGTPLTTVGSNWQQLWCWEPEVLVWDRPYSPSSGVIPGINEVPVTHYESRHFCSHSRIIDSCNPPQSQICNGFAKMRISCNGPRSGHTSLPSLHGSGNKHGSQLLLASPHAADASGQDGMGLEDCEMESVLPYCGKSGLSPECRPPRGSHVEYPFDERGVQLNRNNRTTLMIRNIPNKYSQHMLLLLLDEHCMACNHDITDSNEPQSAYDFVYLPIDFKNRCNLGYAFVNFTTALATLKFYKAFHDRPWELFNSRKICQIAYARVQGRTALEDHFRNSHFACDTDEYLPLMFLSPRTGIERPLPIVAAGHFTGQPQSNFCRLQGINGYHYAKSIPRFCDTEKKSSSFPLEVTSPELACTC